MIPRAVTPLKGNHFTRADDETRTRDPNLGKVVRYQLRYIRMFPNCSGHLYDFSRRFARMQNRARHRVSRN